MAAMTEGAALRLLEQAQAGMRKARGLLRDVREDESLAARAFRAGWETLRQAHKLMASIEVEAAQEKVLTKHLAVSRYATALLVRLRRLERKGTSAFEGDDDDLLEGEDDE